MSIKAKQAARPQAVYAIAQDICHMLPAQRPATAPAIS
jgi:hypothetical protein